MLFNVLKHLRQKKKTLRGGARREKFTNLKILHVRNYTLVSAQITMYPWGCSDLEWIFEFFLDCGHCRFSLRVRQSHCRYQINEGRLRKNLKSTGRHRSISFYGLSLFYLQTSGPDVEPPSPVIFYSCNFLNLCSSRDIKGLTVHAN